MTQKLFVRNLSWSVTEDELIDLFGQVGPVLSVKIPTRREDGKPRGFAFVEMGSAAAAQQAISQFNGAYLHNRDLVVDFQNEDGDRGSHSPRNSSGGNQKHAKLFVRHIGYAVTEDDIQNLFQQVGTVVSVKIPMDRETGSHKGFAFVEMASAEEAEQAINALNQYTLGGKAISIDYQDLNRQKAAPRSGGGYGGGSGYNRSGRW